MDEYDRIARRFFNEFLELKVQLDSGKLSKPMNYDKELAKWKKAAEQFKEAASHLSTQVVGLEDEIAKGAEELQRVRCQLNEALSALAAAKEKLEGLGVVKKETEREGYSFLEHMGPDSRRAWEQIMREIPRPGHD